MPGAYPVHALTIDSDPGDPVNDSVIYAALYDAGIYRSDNAGITWQIKGSGLSEKDMLSLTIDPVTMTTLYAGTWGGGIFRTTNSGEKWTSFNSGLTYTVINRILINPIDPTKLYAGTMFGGIFRCDTEAGTWVQAATNVNDTDINNTYVKDIVIDTVDGTLYAATYTDGSSPIGGVFRSTDDGITWSRVAPLLNNGVFCLEIDGAAGNDTVYAGTYKRLISKTTDSGTTWNVVNNFSPNDLYHIYDSTKVLFSGHTRLTITPISGYYQGYGRFSTIWNIETHKSVYIVSDMNGNPLTAGSTISATVTDGNLTGHTDVTIPDTQSGNTEYYLRWNNNSISPENVAASLTINVSSPDNGNESVTVSRTLIAPVSINPVSETIEAGGGSVTFIAHGGSVVSANYVWTTTGGTFWASRTSTQNGGNTAVLITTDTEDGSKLKITVSDIKCYQYTAAEVNQNSP